MNADDMKRLQAHVYHDIDAMNPVPPETVWRDGQKKMPVTNAIEIFHEFETADWGVLHSLQAQRNYILFIEIVETPNEMHEQTGIWWEGHTPDMSPQNIHVYIALLQRAREIMSEGDA